MIQLFVIAVLAWNVLRFYPGDRWLLVRLGNYFAPWLFMGLVPALVVAALGRRRWLIGATLLQLFVCPRSAAGQRRNQCGPIKSDDVQRPLFKP